MKKVRHLLYVIILIALDQLTKLYALNSLKGEDSFTIIPKVLSLYYHENTGAVWGIMSDKTSLLAVISTVILVFLTFIYFKIPNTKRHLYMQWIVVFITAGAIGNLIDRIFRQYVVDFIYFELIDFPIFNVADMYVSVSAVILIALGLFYYKDEDFEFLESKKIKNK